MNGMTATYSPEDNKLRLYSMTRLDKETYERVNDAGFRWAPKQELFVAPMWTPSREDLLIELCGDVGDEDTSLVDRAEQRAERMEDYSEKRKVEADRAHDAVASITENIPLGQPILIGHHSERHARKDAEKIEKGMQKALKLWETSNYWKDRAAGAVAAAKYKELPGVRARRIKGLESDLRKMEKNIKECEDRLKLWTAEGLTLEKAKLFAASSHTSFKFPLSEYPRTEHTYEGDMSLWSAIEDGIIDERKAAELIIPRLRRGIASYGRWADHYRNRLEYERAMQMEAGGSATDKWTFEVGGRVLSRGEWSTILRVNKSNGAVSSVSTNGKWGGGVLSLDRIKDYQPPEVGAAEKVKGAMKLPPLCNYPGEGFVEITEEQWRKKYSEYKATKEVADGKHGRHRVRWGFFGPANSWGASKANVFITDMKRKDPPALERSVEEEKPVEIAAPERDLDTMTRETERMVAANKARAEKEAEAAKFKGLRDSLAAGVKVVSAPQLFPTPPEIATRMVEAAGSMIGKRVLEPSAGTGNLIRAVVQNATGFECVREVVAVELNVSVASGLRDMRSKFVYTTESNFRIVNSDFLECSVDELGLFDFVIMNPPFERGVDIKHIEHAYKFLKPGGRLVALCAGGPRQRDAFESRAESYEDLSEGSFKEQGTGVNVAMLVMEKPMEVASVVGAKQEEFVFA